MQLILVALLLAVAALAIKLALLLLREPRRSLLTWFRCTAGIACLATAVALASVATDLTGYAASSLADPVLFVEFTELNESERVARLSTTSAEYGSVLFTGDAWSVEVRALLRQRLLGGSDATMLMRPARFSTRHFDIARAGQHNDRSLSDVSRRIPAPIDSWPWLQRFASPLDAVGVRPVALQSAYLPVAPGARFAVYADRSALLVEPVNQLAADALQGLELVKR